MLINNCKEKTDVAISFLYVKESRKDYHDNGFSYNSNLVLTQREALCNSQIASASYVMNKDPGVHRDCSLKSLIRDSQPIDYDESYKKGML